MAKRNRETSLLERRARKAVRKDARKQAAADAAANPGTTAWYALPDPPLDD